MKQMTITKKIIQISFLWMIMVIVAQGQTSTFTNQRHIISPAGGQTANSLQQLYTGYIKITLPQSWSNTMIKMTVDIFDFSTNKNRTLNISGYNYQTSEWLALTANQQSSDEESILVSYGHDGTKCAIYLSKGTNAGDSKWAHAAVLVRDVFVSYNNIEPEKWNTGWQVGFTDILGNNISKINIPSSKPALTNNHHILSPLGGQSINPTQQPYYGYIKITLPQTWSNTMIKMTVDIFEYETNKTRTLNIFWLRLLIRSVV
jgi:hypothetical protein